MRAQDPETERLTWKKVRKNEGYFFKDLTTLAQLAERFKDLGTHCTLYELRKHP